jgi:NAD(P)H dehydrogenase (quinone)
MKLKLGQSKMRFLVVYAHPVEDSFVSSVHQHALEALKDAGHEVDDCDLYAEGFQPVLSRSEQIAYHNQDANNELLLKEAERLRLCNGLVLIFPTWWSGMPAILKGYFDRVWLPGIAFEVAGNRTLPLLQNILKFAVITTYGSPWWFNKAMGDPNKTILMRGMSRLFAKDLRKLWLAQYGMDAINAAVLKAFLQKVSRELRTF